MCRTEKYVTNGGNGGPHLGPVCDGNHNPFDLGGVNVIRLTFPQGEKPYLKTPSIRIHAHYVHTAKKKG